MKSKVALAAALVTCFATSALAQSENGFKENNDRLANNYGHLNLSLSLDSCRRSYVSRAKSNKNISFNSTFNAGKTDAYMNRFMYSFFGSDGNPINPYAQPVAERTIVDGGDNFQWTQALKDSKYKVASGTSKEILNTGKRAWMVRAKPLSEIPDYVPGELYSPKEVENGTAQGYSFAYQLIVLHDDTNTENKFEDDQAISDCVFYYIAS